MANARNNATTFLFVTSFVPLEENGRQISILIIMVAGAQNPELTNVQIKMKLKESARDMGLPKNQQGWGELDLERFMEL